MVSSECADLSLSEENAYRRILIRHAARYPGFTVQDLYKLVYQGALGSEHAAADPLQARLWLEREVEGLGEGPQEPVSDPISADGQIVRINLRPYMAGGGDLNVLLEGFMRTAKEFKGSEGQLKRYWSCAQHLAEQSALGLTVSELKRFFNEMQARGFPAVHHSNEYSKAYRPAYRVVVRGYLDLDQEVP